MNRRSFFAACAASLASLLPTWLIGKRCCCKKFKAKIGNEVVEFTPGWLNLNGQWECLCKATKKRGRRLPTLAVVGRPKIKEYMPT